MTGRVHLMAPGSPEDALSRALCGYLGVSVVRDRKAVTCRLCAREVARADKSRAKVERMDERYRRRMECRNEATVLTPQTWHDMRGLEPGEHPTLDTRAGKHIAQIEADHAKSRHDAERNARVLRNENEYRWSCIERALYSWVVYRFNGVPVASPSPEPSTQGTAGMRDTKGQATVDGVVHVERALEKWADTEHVFSLSELVLILVARLVGRPAKGARARGREPVPVEELAERFRGTPGEIGGVVRRGKRALRVELGARGLVPMPRRTSRDYEAAHTRREELTRGSV